METSDREFRIAMYKEHLEDASFLYDQRKSLLSADNTPWVRLEDFESRLEAHIDALVIGADLALEVCRDRAIEGDAGELYAVVSVYCRNRGSVLLGEVWRSMDFAARDRVRAVTDALKFELPAEWSESCEQAIAHGDPRLVPIMSIVCASRRRRAGFSLLRRLAEDPHLIQPDVVCALSGLSSSSEAGAALEALCFHSDAEVRAAALKALLFLGERRLLRTFYLAAQTDHWPHLALGLGGDQSAAVVLRLCAEAGASSDTLLALGLMGDVSALPVLRRYLDREEMAPTAALSLYWLTGAPLFEDEFVPEPVDELELLDSELVAWRERGELPRRIDGKPFGHAIRRLTCDGTRWQRWLDDNSGRFDSGLRYRRGQPVAPKILLACLLDESTSRSLRELAFDELVIRFGCPVAFDPDWRVIDQRVALLSIADWVMATEAQFEAGRWQ